MKQIRFYIEGGNRSDQKQQLRLGFQAFLRPLLEQVHNLGWAWNITLGGSRNETFKQFVHAHRKYPHSLNILLVDAEAPVTTPPWHHLNKHDGWQVAGMSDDLCHLMVQTVETWFIADPACLVQFYGQRFNQAVLPRTSDVEMIAKQDVLNALRDATDRTSKGRYQKVQHCAELLKRLNVTVVRQRAPHCDRLFVTVQNLI